MTTTGIVKTLRQYREASTESRKHQKYLRIFEEKMLYRTTKTENPQTTKGMVRAVLHKFH